MSVGNFGLAEVEEGPNPGGQSKEPGDRPKTPVTMSTGAGRTSRPASACQPNRERNHVDPVQSNGFPPGLLTSMSPVDSSAAIGSES